MSLTPVPKLEIHDSLSARSILNLVQMHPSKLALDIPNLCSRKNDGPMKENCATLGYEAGFYLGCKVGGQFVLFLIIEVKSVEESYIYKLH